MSNLEQQLQEKEQQLQEAKALLKEVRSYISGTLPCATRDFLGDDLYDRIDLCLYGKVESRDE